VRGNKKVAYIYELGGILSKPLTVHTKIIFDNMALTISIVSLIISGLTFWLTRIWKGSLKMTRPSIICFVGQNGGDEPKVFVRILLFVTCNS
jgi:hypothetical protein